MPRSNTAAEATDKKDSHQKAVGPTTTQLHVVDQTPDAPSVAPRFPIEEGQPMAKGQGSWGVKVHGVLIAVALIGLVVWLA
ncbi:hypothetical protein [Aestuariivita boseongensis]|uniref:hypothetical protein n=1 Tax=Aestuariivita boseongensis TaxID=1470562 RepID=UPI0006822D3A|nr:hypothetical protein [Aestuariivita boseongensis]